MIKILYLLEFLGVNQKSFTIAFSLGKFIQLSWTGRIWKLSFGNSSNKNLQHRSQGAPSLCPITIIRPSYQENEQRDGHDNCENDISSTPIDTFLSIHNHGHSQNDSTAQSTVPPVEK